MIITIVSRPIIFQFLDGQWQRFEDALDYNSVSDLNPGAQAFVPGTATQQELDQQLDDVLEALAPKPKGASGEGPWQWPKKSMKGCEVPVLVPNTVNKFAAFSEDDIDNVPMVKQSQVPQKPTGDDAAFKHSIFAKIPEAKQKAAGSKAEKTAPAKSPAAEKAAAKEAAKATAKKAAADKAAAVETAAEKAAAEEAAKKEKAAAGEAAKAATEQATAASEVSQVRMIDTIVDVPVVKNRQVPSAQAMQKTFEVPEVQIFDTIVDVPVVKQRPVPSTQNVPKTVEVPKMQIIDKTAEEKAVEVPKTQMFDTFVDVQTVPKTVEVPKYCKSSPDESGSRFVCGETSNLAKRGLVQAAEKATAEKATAKKNEHPGPWASGFVFEDVKGAAEQEEDQAGKSVNLSFSAKTETMFARWRTGT